MEIGIGIEIGGGRHIVISTEAKRRNLPAEWDWWLSAPDGAVGVGIKDRGAVERVFANGKF